MPADTAHAANLPFQRFGMADDYLETQAGRPGNKKRLLSFSAGQMIPKLSQEGGNLAYLFSGSVIGTIESHKPVRRRQAVVGFNPGQWIGIKHVVAAYMNANPGIDLDYQAVGDVSLLLISREHALEMMEVNRAFSEFILSRHMSESSALTQILLDAKYGNHVYRIVSGLASMCESCLESNNSLNASLSRFALRQVKLPFPQSILADLFGVSRSVLSPTMIFLKKHGWLDLQYGQTLLEKPAVWCTLGERIRSDKGIAKVFSLDEAIKQLMLSESATEEAS